MTVAVIARALAVAAVDVLDHLFSAIPRREVEVDVAPFAALWRGSVRTCSIDTASTAVMPSA
jgi:hypothetical protein